MSDERHAFFERQKEQEKAELVRSFYEKKDKIG